MKIKIPEELAIPRASYPSPTELTNIVTQAGAPIVCESGGKLDPREGEITNLSKAMISLANQIWRMSVAIRDSDSKEAKAEFTSQDVRKISNALDAMGETIDGLGIKVIDRLNESFNAGLPDQVVTEEPREGISKEQIIRTIRPTIIWHQTMVQRGEIDIAVPVSKHPSNTPS